MKKFLKFIFKLLVVIAILLAFMSFCSYDLFKKAAKNKVQEVASTMFGSPVLINHELSSGENYNLIVENPSTFNPGNMILLQEINNTSTEKNVKDLVLKNLTINYAINKNNKINLHIMRDNTQIYAAQNINQLNQVNQFNELFKSGNNDNNQNNDSKNKSDNNDKDNIYVRSITFINPTLLLFIDGEYKGITTIPSFALQFSSNESSSTIKIVLETVVNLTNQSDKAVLKLYNNINK